jgi:hypothetical protein
VEFRDQPKERYAVSADSHHMADHGRVRPHVYRAPWREGRDHDRSNAVNVVVHSAFTRRADKRSIFDYIEFNLQIYKTKNRSI